MSRTPNLGGGGCDSGFGLFRDEVGRCLSHVHHDERSHRRMSPALEVKLGLDVIWAWESLHGFDDLEVEAVIGGEDGNDEADRVGDTVTDEELEEGEGKGVG